MHCLKLLLVLSLFSIVVSEFSFKEEYFLKPYDAGKLKSSLGFSCLDWTPWVSADFPTGEGDWETVSAPGDKGTPGTIDQFLRDIEVCNTPVTVQCRSRFDNTSWTEIHDVLTVPCTTRRGLVCQTQKQPYERLCRDYEVRFLCWKKCLNLEWSGWFDLDDPDDHGDVEILGETILRDRWPCSGGEIPVDAQCQTLTGIPSRQSKKRGLQCSNFGFSCLNSYQDDDCRCDDFKVRFLCPVKQNFPGGYKQAPIELRTQV